jgi:dipeptidyl-peptidase-3
MLYSAIKGLQFFNKEENMWGQAHIWAAWVIFQCVREDAPGIIKIEFSKTPESKDWFTMHVDRSKLRSTGFQALNNFLHKLHVYKSIGDFDVAEKFFQHYSEVDEEMLKVREIVMANRVPRRIELQPNILRTTDARNIFVETEGETATLEYKDYD